MDLAPGLLMLKPRRLRSSWKSTCTSASVEPSYVLRALGVPDDLAHSSLRFGLGRFNTAEEIDYVIDEVASQVRHLRSMSPTMALAGAGVG